jgi:SAM-dependent methyltransferase
MAQQCPVCGGDTFAEFLSEEAIRLEALMRSQFVLDRTERTPPPAERKDLTEFAHGASARILICNRCSTLLRDERGAAPDAVYVNDPYDPAVIERLLPRYLAAYRSRETPYRALLPSAASVLEIGPHFGAFLQAAAEWGWEAVGIDIGKDTSRFLAERGYVIYNRAVEECAFPDGRFDGVFIWNCFEQIPDPGRTLAEAHRLLKRRGIVVIRTPNALFYRVAEQFLRRRDPAELSNWVLRALGYNNLLAFPYLYGYGSAQLNALAQRHGFQCESALDSELITLPFPELHDWIVEENRATTAALLDWSELACYSARSELTGPWMEIIYRV